MEEPKNITTMPFETELCEIAFKYGTDKCPQLVHPYTPVYYEMLKDKRNSVKKVLELGIGAYKNMMHANIVWDGRLNRHYHKGASLKMWRDFFPNAQVYGVDNQPACMFEDERIKTFVGDAINKEDWSRILEQTGTDIDLFVDDGSHGRMHQLDTARILMPLLKKDVIYVIEDVRHPAWVKGKIEALTDYYCDQPKLKFVVPKHLDCLLVVKRK